jgi:hypothetical protein
MTAPRVDIYVTPHDVRVESTIIKRPDRISSMQWLDFWRNATDDRGGFDDGFEAGEGEARSLGYGNIGVAD